MQQAELRSPAPRRAAAPSTYDLVAYESHPFPRTHIRHLHAMARLFGLTPADPDHCRVLEFGCAAGGNLLPMAIDHPHSRFTGVDIASREIEKGRRQIAELGVKNMELRALSLTDTDESFGRFDYIIAHGVYSWVPAEIRERLLPICRERLAPGGVVLISYNTLPGWATWQGLRDMILYSGRDLPDPQERAGHARRLLDALHRTGRNDHSPYWEMLRQEIEKTSDLSDWFFLHEHVEEENTPVYFHDFVEHARQADLDYLGEADLTAMNLGGLPTPRIELPGMAEDPVFRLQYLDLVQNRRFRMSLLCHQGEKSDVALTSDRLWDFHWTSILRPQMPLADPAAAIAGMLTFVGPAGEIRLKTADPASGAVFDTLCRQKLPARPGDVVSQAMARFGIEDGEALRAALLRPALGLVMANLITPHSFPGNWASGVSERPLASRLARHQARRSDWITTQRHEPLGADPVLREVIRLADGRHSRTAMIEELRHLAARGKLGLHQQGQAVRDPAAAARVIPALVDQLLAFLADQAVLVG